VLSENLFQEGRLAYICELDLYACKRSHEKVYVNLKNEYSRCVDAASRVGEQNSEIVMLLPIHILSESGLVSVSGTGLCRPGITRRLGI